MKLRVCDYCKQLKLAKDVKPCILNGKSAFVCNDCLAQAQGKITKELLVNGLNNKTIRIKGVK